MITYCTATSGDIPDITTLLDEAHLPKAGLEAHVLNFILALDGEQVVGCAGLEVHQDCGLLRSVVVAPGYRTHGIGAKLTEGIIELAQQKNLTSLSLLTETAQNYFPRFGFVPVPRSELPAALEASEELRGACPDTATAMMLRLE
ncbi:MAG: arsenic resistance N-acetyltransferase ArsN2 [Meiothermus sp.]|uniref:arsenic resistance N-acetyltransferase ArsN2 n=1 Tax=Meiothermus sp. TaxID=1955249 RepID=UPI0025D8E24C|nr:arsenic resistance N-acetyltransferase ArsN2 [Meiothermus sp.]MCS7067271.1 arsenic resistance N-acetyltransferase ArsN2 [Meiothermus sp.]MCX7601689.1 arsenic resistance N-acetyltransferase ArsN2 [Meiothermus sp.]MDW8425559.1 arsenic resistance N-acetyltransferase ArsN2 [Meiothermus sp.]